MANRFQWREVRFVLGLAITVLILAVIASCRTSRITLQDVAVGPATPSGPWAPYSSNNTVPTPPRPPVVLKIALPVRAEAFVTVSPSNQVCVTNRRLGTVTCVTQGTNPPVLPVQAYEFIWHLPPTNGFLTVQSTTDWVTWKLEQSGWVTNGGTVCVMDIGNGSQKHYKLVEKFTN